MSVCNNSAPTGRIFVKFYIWVFFENLLRKFVYDLNLTRTAGNLRKDLCTFMIISHRILLRMRSVSNKNCRENQNTYILFSNFFFPKIVWFMRQCGTKCHTDHRWQYNIMVIWMHLNVTLCIRCLSCLHIIMSKRVDVDLNIVWGLWSACTWLRVQSNGKVFYLQLWIIRFHKFQGVLFLARWPSSSEEGLCFIELHS
jgi:hypothetical protein